MIKESDVAQFIKPFENPDYSKKKEKEDWLEAEWERQIDRLIDLGFHKEKEIGQTKGKYKDSLPKFFPQLPEYKGLFDIPLLIDPRIPLSIQHKLIDIKERVKSDHIINLTPVPYVPYAIWGADPHKYIKKFYDPNFNENDLGFVRSPQIEVTGLFMHYPKLFWENIVFSRGSYIKDGNFYRGNTYLNLGGAYFEFRKNRIYVENLLRGKYKVSLNATADCGGPSFFRGNLINVQTQNIDHRELAINFDKVRIAQDISSIT